jgi:hypothetical protein
MSDFRIVSNKREAAVQIKKILDSIKPGEAMEINLLEKQILINNGLSGSSVEQMIKKIMDRDCYIEDGFILRESKHKVEEPKDLTPEEEADATFKAMGLK